MFAVKKKFFQPEPEDKLEMTEQQSGESTTLSYGMLWNGPGTTQDLWICCRSFAMSPRVEQDLQKEVKKIAYFISEFGSPGLWG